MHPEILSSKRDSEEQIAIGPVSAVCVLSDPSFDSYDVDNTSNNVTPNTIVILANN